MDSVEELNAMQLERADKLSAEGDYAEALKVYGEALRNSTAAQRQLITERINAIRESLKKPKPPKPEPKREDSGFSVQRVSFADVIGYKRQKAFTKDLLELPIKNRELYTRHRQPKSAGIILYGPPGTGKTLFTKALSGELGIPMKDISISGILDKFVGGSEKNMAKAFADAKACQPSILFFDELDALGASRESSNDFTSNDIRNTVNEFLKQVSELHDNKEMMVHVIGATNLPWLLDDAIKRSGRLERHIYMPPPGLLDRKRLFDYYLQLGEQTFKGWLKMKGATEKDIALDVGKAFQHYHRKWLKESGHKVNTIWLSLATIRYSQADIEKVCNSAHRRAIKAGREAITTYDVQKVLHDRNDGESSLDEWILKARKTYIRTSKTVMHRTGFMGWRKQKEQVEEQGKLDSGELRIYKPMINDIKWNMRWWNLVNVIRFIARGI